MNAGPIFVFGSNRAGIHGAGSALHARKFFGAVLGKGEGRTGQSFAIPTKDEFLRVLPLDDIRKSVGKFIFYALEHPDLHFQVVPIGCGLAGYTPDDIAPMFEKAPANVELPDVFLKVLGR
jgi:hypothetical protein